MFFHAEKQALAKGSSSSYAASKVDAVLTFVRSPTNRLYCLFLAETFKVFEIYLKTFQAEAPLVHRLRREMLTLMRAILSKFVKPSALLYKDLTKVEYKLPYNQKADSELIIGEDARAFLEDKEANHLKDSRIAEFFSNTKKFFVELCDYLFKWLPISDPLLQHAEVTDVNLQLESEVQSLRFFIKKFPALLPPGVSIGAVTDQFALYQATDISDCLQEKEKQVGPDEEEAEEKDTGKTDLRLDQIWHSIGQLQDGTFSDLSLVMRGVLTIPHSSAHCERVFSCVRKNKTEQRASMKDETLDSLLVVKGSKKTPVEAVKSLNTSQLKKLRSAYYLRLKKKPVHKN